MDCFIKHNLIKAEDGYTLVLYINRQLSEFAKDFDNIDHDKRKGFEESIKSYIHKKFPNVAIKTVNIMLGSIMIASLPISAIDAQATAIERKINYTQSEAKGYQDYRVKTGDTLYKIASQYGTTIKSIKTANNLQSDVIFVNQILKIPLYLDYLEYFVKPGDTLYQISQRNGISVKELKTFNNLNSNLILVDQRLKIPVNRGSVSIGEQQYFNYTVKSGDYLYIISTQFDVSIDSIKSANNIHGNTIIVGQTLRIPNPNSAQLVSYPDHLVVIANKEYRLPRDYVPQNLVIPDVDFTFEEYHPKKLMRSDAAKNLEELFKQAERDGIELYAISGYRSYDTQEYIFTSKVMDRGVYVANMTSAKPGESEHQTGLAMDVTSPSANFALTQYFGETREGRWLKVNAPKYGFIIRYPQGKESITGYSYEPWHIRYVGESAARFIMAEKMTLEEYMGNL